MSEAPDSARTVQVTLMGVLIGVGLPMAISTTASSPSWPLVLACCGYVVQTLNFFHGKVATLGDSDYSLLLKARPVISLFDYAFNMLLVIHFVIVAAIIREPTAAMLTNVSLRIVDLVLVYVTLHVTFSANLRRAHYSWLIFDVLSAGLWIVVCTVGQSLNEDDRLAAYGVAYFVIAVADILMDFSYNRALYFQPPNPWESFTSAWDVMQGEEGDEFRQQIIVPPLLEELDALKVRSVIDVGSGNGCIARAIGATGRVVIGVDASESMVSAAESYGLLGSISYVVGDVRKYAQLSLPQVDAVVSVFSHHDIGDLQAIFGLARQVLPPGGSIIFVGEDLEQLEGVRDHDNTYRRWLQRRARSGARSQLLYWRERQSDDVKAITEAIYWHTSVYESVGLSYGFSRASSSTLLQAPEKTQLHALRRYRSRPYIRLQSFRLSEEANVPVV